MASRVQVAARVRPQLGTERYDFVCCGKDDDRILLTKPDDDRWAETHKSAFRFDFSFDAEDSQSEVYSVAVRPLLEHLLSATGKALTIFTYGQTGSGKTYTLLGEAKGEISADSGIFLRAMADILQLPYHITLAAVEIYNEELRDLFTGNVLIPRAGKTGQDELPDLELKHVDSLQVVLQLFSQASHKRITHKHALNDVSSRSHAAFFVNISKDGGDVSRLVLVDLAGSERVLRSGVDGDHLKEAQFINLSLTSLGKVVSAINEGRKHIPYRDSKLTRLLRTTFEDENSNILLIANLSPAMLSFTETWSSIQFADRVKLLETKAHFSTSAFLDNKYMQLQQDLTMLCADLRIAQAAGHVMHRCMRVGHQQVQLQTNREPYWAVMRSHIEGARFHLRQLEQQTDVLTIDLALLDAQNQALHDEVQSLNWYFTSVSEQFTTIVLIRKLARRSVKLIHHRLGESLSLFQDMLCTFNQCTAAWDAMEMGDEAWAIAPTSETIFISVLSPHKSPQSTTSMIVVDEPPLPDTTNPYIIPSDVLERLRYLRANPPVLLSEADLELCLSEAQRCLPSNIHQLLFVLSIISSLAEQTQGLRLQLLPSAPNFVAAMRLHSQNHTLQGQCVSGLLQLSREPAGLATIVRLGAIGRVVEAMQQFPNNAALQTISCAAMWSFGTSKENKPLVAREGGIVSILNAMRNFPKMPELLTRANAALCNLAANAENSVEIAAQDGIEVILGTMRDHAHNPDLLTSANVALSNLAVNTDNNRRIATSGGVQLVLLSMTNFPQHPALLCRALSAVCSLALTVESKLLVLEHNGVELILRTMAAHRDNPVLLTKANATLWNLAEHEQLHDRIRELEGYELVRQSLRDFPNNPELVKEAMGALTRKKFVAITC